MKAALYVIGAAVVAAAWVCTRSWALAIVAGYLTGRATCLVQAISWRKPS